MNREEKINPLVKSVTEDYLNRVDKRKKLEKIWLLNQNFYIGNQYAEILPSGDLAEQSKRYYWEQKKVFNHIAPIIEARLSKFNNLKASVSVRPATSDENDVFSAKFSTAVLDSFKEANNFRSITSEAIFWAEITGAAFYKVCWDKYKGACLSKEKNVYEGDVRVTVVPSYEIFPDDLTASGVEELRSLIHAKAYPVEEVENAWGVKIDPEKVSVMTFDGMNAFKNEALVKKALCADKENYVVVIEEYRAPTAENRDGRLIIVAGDKLLYDGSLPYVNGDNGERKIPFVRQVALNAPSNFFGSSIIERLIPVQKSYNDVKNRKAEFFNRMTAGVLVAEDGSVDVDDLDEEGIAPGKVVVYRQGCNPPQMMTFGSVPSDFAEEEDRLLEEFATISGVTDFGNKNSFSSVNMSATALNLMLEQANSKLTVTTESIRNAIKEVSKQTLRLYRQYAVGSRLIKIAGDNGERELVAFKGSDITSDDVVFDFEDESVSTLSNRKDFLKEVFDMGLLNDEDGKLDESAKTKLLDLLGFGSWKRVKDEDDLQKKRALKENEEIKIKVPEVNVYDNHSIHIEEHTKFILRLDDAEESVKEAISEHIKAHRKALGEDITENREEAQRDIIK